MLQLDDTLSLFSNKKWVYIYSEGFEQMFIRFNFSC
jgi:hypothetical protein